jgi:hypothetical protein
MSWVLCQPKAADATEALADEYEVGVATFRRPFKALSIRPREAQTARSFANHRAAAIGFANAVPDAGRRCGGCWPTVGVA